MSEAVNVYPQVVDLANNVYGLSGQNCTIGSSYFSCGISMLYGLTGQSPEAVVNKVLKERSQSDKKTVREAFVLFTDQDNKAHGWGGNAICRYIKEKGLGNIVEFGPRMNPNTGNMIKLWVWEPPHESLAPEDKYMPIHGKILKRDQLGQLQYHPDPRFVDQRAGKEA